MLVVDASVLAPVVADGGSQSRRFRERPRHESIAGPDLLRVEVISVLRRHAGREHLSAQQADAAIDDLLTFPIAVYPTAMLLRRTWELCPT